MKKPLREPLLELFVAEDLVSLDGKLVTATTFVELASVLHSRKEFPEPVKHWSGVPGKADAA